MLYIENDRVESQPVGTIEGRPNTGTVFVKPLIRGDNMALLEVRMRAGVASSRVPALRSQWLSPDHGERRDLRARAGRRLSPSARCRSSGGSAGRHGIRRGEVAADPVRADIRIRDSGVTDLPHQRTKD
jgi:hypothetical protein